MPLHLHPHRPLSLVVRRNNHISAGHRARARETLLLRQALTCSLPAHYASAIGCPRLQQAQGKLSSMQQAEHVANQPPLHSDSGKEQHCEVHNMAGSSLCTAAAACRTQAGGSTVTASGRISSGSPKATPIFTRGPENSRLPSAGLMLGLQAGCCRTLETHVACTSPSWTCRGYRSVAMQSFAFDISTTDNRYLFQHCSGYSKPQPAGSAIVSDFRWQDTDRCCGGLQCWPHHHTDLPAIAGREANSLA